MRYEGTAGYRVFFDGLGILNLTDVNSPSQIGQVELSTGGQRVDVTDNNPCVVSGRSLVALVDISSLNHSSLINNLKTIIPPHQDRSSFYPLINSLSFSLLISLEERAFSSSK